MTDSSATSGEADTCAEMRALCSSCGGTGDIHSVDGEWRGSCDCEASAWSRAPAPPSHEAAPLSQVIQTEVEKWENRLTDAETALHNIEAARQRQAVAEAILMRQVANWTEERDRLQDLINTATKSS